MKKSQSIVELARPTVPLAQATARLADVMARIDNGEEITDVMQSEFVETRLVEQAAVDETIAFRGFLDAAELHAKQAAEEWSRRSSQIARMRDNLDEQIKKAVTMADGRPLRGSIGGLKVKKNPPSLKPEWGSTTIDANIIFEFGISPEYYDTIEIPPKPAETVYKLKTQAVKDAINNGADIKWAKTTRGEKVEVTK